MSSQRNKLVTTVSENVKHMERRVSELAQLKNTVPPRMFVLDHDAVRRVVKRARAAEDRACNALVKINALRQKQGRRTLKQTVRERSIRAKFRKVATKLRKVEKDLGLDKLHLRERDVRACVFGEITDDKDRDRTRAAF